MSIGHLVQLQIGVSSGVRFVRYSLYGGHIWVVAFMEKFEIQFIFDGDVLIEFTKILV